MWKVEEKAGLSEGYYSKMLHADSGDGRRASLERIEQVLDAVFEGAYIARFANQRFDPLLATARLKKINPNLRTYFRHHMISIAPLGAQALNAKLTPEQRRANARKASRVRWERHRQLSTPPP